MKKYISLVAALTAIFGTSRLFAITGDAVTTPASRAGANTIQSADYGGVQLSTWNFTSSANELFTGEGIVYGVIFSTGNNLDFITFRDSNTPNTSSLEAFRLYNTNVASVTTSGGSVMWAGPVLLKYPVRFKNGCSFNANVATYNTMSVLYYKR